MTSACTSGGEPANSLSPFLIAASSAERSGRTASQKSFRSPHLTSTSLVASPSKKREIGPRVGSWVE